MKTPVSTEKPAERAVLVGVIEQGVSDWDAQEHLDELALLAQTAGAKCIKIFTQNLAKPHPKYFVGSGKLEEIVEYISAENADILIFDDELSASQLRNIGRELPDIKILDRSHLIFDIFASRAQTAQAKTQIELAQCQYLLPRLTRMWTHLERQKGGIGMRGPGESQIETDRRIILAKTSFLKERLSKIDKQNAAQRKHRDCLVRVALTGYTNAGKSTLMNLLSKSSDVLAENKLFATLDTTVRKVVIHNIPVLLSDTVGFIRNLPHHLIESFNSTLAEVKEADLLIHVVDVSHPACLDHMKTVRDTLQKLGASEKPVIVVFNKEDACVVPDAEGKDVPTCTGLKKDQLERLGDSAIFMSALVDKDAAEKNLRQAIYQQIEAVHNSRFPHNLPVIDHVSKHR